jgi:hypothetical protein
MQRDYANLHDRPDSATEEVGCPQTYRNAGYTLPTMSDCNHIETVHDTEGMCQFKKPESDINMC